MCNTTVHYCYMYTTAKCNTSTVLNHQITMIWLQRIRKHAKSKYWQQRYFNLDFHSRSVCFLFWPLFSELTLPVDHFDTPTCETNVTQKQPDAAMEAAKEGNSLEPRMISRLIQSCQYSLEQVCIGL